MWKRIFAATATEQPSWSRESGCFVFFFFFLGGCCLFFASMSGRDTERASVQLWGVPSSSTKLLQLPSPSSSSSSWTVCKRERETVGEWESHAYKPVERRRQEEDPRRGRERKKKILLSLLLPLFAHLTGSGEQKRSPAGVFPHSVFPPFLRLYQTVGGARGEPPPRARPVTSLLSRRRVSARAGMLNNLTDTEEGDGGAQSQGEWWDASGSCTHTDDTRVRWHNDAGILYVCPLSSKPRKVNIRNAGSHSTQLQRPSEDTCVCVRAHACVCVLRHCTLGSLLPSTAAALTARLLWQE